MQPLRDNKERTPKRRKPKPWVLEYTIQSREPFTLKQRYPTERDALQAKEALLLGRGLFGRWKVVEWKIYKRD